MSFVERAKALQQATGIGTRTARQMFLDDCLPELIAVVELADRIEGIDYRFCAADHIKLGKALDVLDQKADSGREE